MDGTRATRVEKERSEKKMNDALGEFLLGYFTALILGALLALFVSFFVAPVAAAAIEIYWRMFPERKEARRRAAEGYDDESDDTPHSVIPSISEEERARREMLLKSRDPNDYETYEEWYEVLTSCGEKDPSPEAEANLRRRWVEGRKEGKCSQ